MPFPDREEQGAAGSNSHVAEGLELGFPDIGLAAALAFHEQGDAGLQGDQVTGTGSRTPDHKEPGFLELAFDGVFEASPPRIVAGQAKSRWTGGPVTRPATKAPSTRLDHRSS